MEPAAPSRGLTPAIRVRHISIGRTLARTRVLLLVQDLDVRIIKAATSERTEPTTGKAVATRQATALADLSVSEAEARLQLDWDKPLRHMTFYKAVYRPSVLRANRLVPTARLSAELKFHSLRHTYASLCIAAGIPPLELSRFMGHNKVTTTLGIYTHLFEDGHAAAMAALGAMGGYTPNTNYGKNVVPLRG